MQSGTVLVTGGAGFIGSNFVLQWISDESTPLTILDKLTYAGNLSNLAKVSSEPRYRLIQGDIGDRELVRTLLRSERPRAIVHFAAESHVDRSIEGPDDFIRTNINGTASLLEETRDYWLNWTKIKRAASAFSTCPRTKYTGRSGPGSAFFGAHTLLTQQPI